MQLVVAVSTLAFVLASAVIGARLLLLARRTGGRPELLLGLCLFCVGGISFPIGALGRTSWLGLQAVAVGAMALSGVCVLVFTQQVFRPAGSGGGSGGRAGVALASGLSLCWIGFALSGWVTLWRSGQPLPPTGVRVVARHGLMLAGFGWAALESVVYFAKLRRRVPIGLADPVVANRILLWALCAGFAALLNVPLLAVAVSGGDTMTAGPLRLIIAVGGSGAAICLLLAFFPPKGYLDAVRARAGATQA